MTKTARTLLIVDDCPEDRALYRRYLQRDSEYEYTVLEAESGQQGLALWQQHSPDAVLLDYRLPSLNGLELLAQLQPSQHRQCPVIMVTGQGNEAIAVQSMKAGVQDYLVKGAITLEGLRLAVNSAIETEQLRAHLHQRIEREKLVSKITQKIHQTLDLEEILQTTVTEVRRFLKSDRVLIFRLHSDGHGTVQTESVGENWTSLLSTSYQDPCLSADYIKSFRQGSATLTSNIHDGSLNPCHVELLEQLQVQANLVVPILQNEQLWGLLVVHHCESPRLWQPLEVELLTELATQAGIALQQAQLYQRSQTELTERKQAEAQQQILLQREQAARAEAEQANRTKDEFLAVVSHELRTPLNPILGWSQLLKGGQLDAQKTDHALETIVRNAKIQSQLIDDLLDVSRILRGHLSLEKAPVDPVFIIQAALETVRLAAEAKSIEIQTYLNWAGGTVLGDDGRLQQIIWNLAANAIKFTPPGGRINIRLEQVGEQATILISDTGKGIPPEFLPYVFDRFWQQDAATTRQFGGLGLGLAIVRSLVELHDGTVRVDSAGEGQGTTFTVEIPLMLKRPVARAAMPPLSRLMDLSGVQIWIVDDNTDTCDVVTCVLEQAGATVIAMPSANEALATLAQVLPDVLISDIGMPETDGYMLLRQVRALAAEQGGQIPAIALTAYASELDHQQVLSAGFQTHLTKPVEPDALIEAIFKLIQPH